MHLFISPGLPSAVLRAAADRAAFAAVRDRDGTWSVTKSRNHPIPPGTLSLDELLAHLKERLAMPPAPPASPATLYGSLAAYTVFRFDRDAADAPVGLFQVSGRGDRAAWGLTTGTECLPDASMPVLLAPTVLPLWLRSMQPFASLDHGLRFELDGRLGVWVKTGYEEAVPADGAATTLLLHGTTPVRALP